MTASVREGVKYATVVVPLDGSHLAATALTHAVALARPFGAKVVLLHVMAPEDGTGRSLERHALRSQLEAYLDGLKRSLSDFGTIIEWRIEEGSPVSTIVKVAAELPDAIIVMSRAGRTASQPQAAGERFGAVAEEMVREWGGPLLLVRPYV